MIISNKYKLIKGIGEGAFGQIYEATFRVKVIRNGKEITLGHFNSQMG